jgi:hypothetical protein
MPDVTIIDPARFNNDGLGTRRFIRAAFFDQGYGSSTSFKAYARNAGIVPDTAPFSTIGLGTSGSPLRMSQFSGLLVPSPVVISIADDYIAADAVYETDFDFNSATYGISPTGLIDASSFSTNGGGTDGTTNGTNWVTPTSSASLYEVRATKVSGSAFQPTGSALGTWLSCTNSESWSLQLTGIGRLDCVLTIEIRDAATQTIRDTATITMMAKNQN